MGGVSDSDSELACVTLVLMEASVTVWGISVKCEPLCLKSGPLKGSGPTGCWSDDFQYARD